MVDYTQFPSPCYVMEEDLLRRNLALIHSVADRADVEIILAFKAYALWRTFPIFREYIHATTASSPYEARLALEEFGSKAHTYSPAYTEADFPEIMRCSSHITFNSLSQYQRFWPQVQAHGHISCGLRINPEYSEVETELYNPCAPGTRFGVMAEQLPARLPEGIEGFHCHCHCESSSYELERSLAHIEEKFSPWFAQIHWLNLGGGHLMTRKDYDVELLIKCIKHIQDTYGLQVYLEPGEAVALNAGTLVASVLDFNQNGITNCFLDTSSACHMPDVLEMPYRPRVVGAAEPNVKPYTYRFGGPTCLAGDIIGDYSFDQPLKIGDQVVFEDMAIYTMVKNNTFNGLNLPSIVLQRLDGSMQLLKQFGYEDFKRRL